MVHKKAKAQKKMDQLSLALDSGTLVDVRQMLNGLAPADVAHLLESSKPEFRHILWRGVGYVMRQLLTPLRSLLE